MAGIAVSTAKVEITPALSMNPWMGGYATGDTGGRAATGTRTPLFARCVVFWDNGFPNAIAIADVLAFPRTMHQAIRQRVIGLTNQWSPSDFVLAATHTHNGPALVDKLDPYMAYGITDLSPLVSYSNWLQDRMVNLVETALAAPQINCTLDYKVGSQSFSYNREGLPYVESAVPILVARATNGHPLAIMFSYGTHPVTAGNQNLWDGDFPSGSVSTVESSTGAFAMFLPGPEGDQDPTGGVRNFTTRDQLSAQLGNAVSQASMSPGRTVTGPIQTSYQELSLPLDITDTPGNLAAVKADYQVRQNMASLPAYYRRHASRMIQQVDAHSFVTTVPLPIQAWKLQGTPLLRMAFVGGELVSGYAVYFRNQFGGSNGLYIGGYANEVPTYVPSNELLQPIRRGGSYAGGWDADYPGIAGGAMTVYGYLGHFRTSTIGVEQVMVSGLTSLLT